jgi:N-acetylneuraminate synthase/N,N'-diacetyllegionaminate synthase
MLSIFSRKVAPDQPVFVIAEIGVNHDGQMSRALELVELAHKARADAVKLQIFSAQWLMNAASAFAGYQAERVADASPIDMLRRYELSFDQLEELVEVIRDRGMIPLATPFSIADIAVIERLRLPAIKIASPDLVNRPLLEAAAHLRKPLLVSTGASSIDEIAQAANWLREIGAAFALLHCVSAYPVPERDANLCWIGELAHRFDAVAGYSDHTTDLSAGALAVAAGACIVEKHLTYDRAASGPDHAASADPEQFRQYVMAIRHAERLRGVPGRRVLPCEQDVRKVSRQSLVLRRDLRPGDELRDEDLIIQRPGTGIPAADLSRVVGCKLIAPTPAGTLLQWDMLHAA